MWKSPIKKERKQGGNHARLITGYISHGDRITSLIYADSWGKKGLNKTMSITDAWRMTKHIGPVYPKNIKPEIAAELAELTKPPKVQRRDPFAP